MTKQSRMSAERIGSGTAFRFAEDDLAALAKALAHPARIRIIRLLLHKQACIGCDIVDDVGLAQSTVSEHLRILKTAGVITGEVEHPRVCYSLNPDRLIPLASLLATVLEKDSRADTPEHSAGYRRVRV